VGKAVLTPCRVSAHWLAWAHMHICINPTYICMEWVVAHRVLHSTVQGNEGGGQKSSLFSECGAAAAVAWHGTARHGTARHGLTYEKLVGSVNFMGWPGHGRGMASPSGRTAADLASASTNPLLEQSVSNRIPNKTPRCRPSFAYVLPCPVFSLVLSSPHQ